MNRKLLIRIEGVNGRVDEHAIIIASRDPLKVLSSAVLNGGLIQARSIINCHVDNNFKSSHPSAYLQKITSKLALLGPTVGLMTAAKLKNYSLRTSRDAGVTAMVTAGLSYPAAAGDEIDVGRAHHGTINTILIIDGSLTDSAMVDAVKTATEAKTLALKGLDVRSRFSVEVASGTITDSVCVSCTQRGKRWKYAGTATSVGQAIAKTTRGAIEEGVLKENGLIGNRAVLSRLSERGIQLTDLVKTGMELFRPSPRISKQRATFLLERGLVRALSDVNVASLVIAAVRLDEEGRTGTLPKLTAQAFLADPISLVADEAIGNAIANYIGGTLGMHNFQYYDRMKPGIAKKLPPFMDDAVCGLVAGVMSRVLYDSATH